MHKLIFSQAICDHKVLKKHIYFLNKFSICLCANKTNNSFSFVGWDNYSGLKQKIGIWGKYACSHGQTRLCLVGELAGVCCWLHW